MLTYVTLSQPMLFNRGFSETSRKLFTVTPLQGHEQLIHDIIILKNKSKQLLLHFLADYKNGFLFQLKWTLYHLSRTRNAAWVGLKQVFHKS